jgi:sugar phosphate isomerase/epimerase
MHPSRGTLYKIKDSLGNIVQPIVEEHNLSIAWENVTQQDRYLNDDNELREYMEKNLNNYRCFDINHSKLSQTEMIKYIEDNSDMIREFHLSNRLKGEVDSHLPIFDPSGDIDAKEIFKAIKGNFSSVRVVLEYESRGRDLDVKAVSYFINGNRTEENK